MRIPLNGLNLLSRGLSDQAKRQWPWLAMGVDVLVVFGQIYILFQVFY